MILFNGSTGGIGRYLGPAIESRGLAAHALAARLEDSAALERELDSLSPEGEVTFVHLAAWVSVPTCEADPAGARHVNVVLAREAAATILRWTASRQVRTRLIYVSTGHVYAGSTDRTRLSEDSELGPRSTYARTKLEAERELAILAADHAVPLLTARVFGLVAPEQAENYVLPGLIRRVRQGDVQEIPGLDFVRDYLDARDVCEGLLELAATEWPAPATVVNLCSGIPVAIRDLLGVVLGVLQPASADARLSEVRSAPGRPDDVPWLVGDPGRFIAITGASPQHIPLVESVRDALAAQGGP